MKTTPSTLKTIVLASVMLITSLSWAQSTAEYNISLTTIWNTTDHTSVPGNAHWSPLVGATHNTVNEFVEIGALASLGIKNVAEGGDNTEIKSEINSAINANPTRSDQLLEDGFSPFAGNNSNASFSNVTISEAFPLITLVSMVAPSPDWFIAVNSLNLRSGNAGVNNGWKETFTMDVFAYDSGTDSGTNYGSGDQVTSPFDPVSMVTGFPINGNRMATITFTYISSTLSTDDFSLQNVKVYPNPATSVLNITNTNNNNLESVELYNVLGKQVNIVSASNGNSMAINTSSLQSGLYVLKLNGTDGASSSRKVIIE